VLCSVKLSDAVVMIMLIVLAEVSAAATTHISVGAMLQHCSVSRQFADGGTGMEHPSSFVIIAPSFTMFKRQLKALRV